MEKYKVKRLIAGAALIAAGGLALSACSTGQVEPPKIEEIRDRGEFFELTRPDGSEMLCWQFGARGEGPYGESPSWFSVTCDWAGEYQLAETTTTTTAQPETLPTINEVG